VALVLADAGRWLFVANRRGTISVIDTVALKATAEVPVGKALSDLATTPDGSHLVALDEGAHQVLILKRKGPALEIERRQPVSPYPVSVQVAPDGQKCYVASLWSRRLSAVNLGHTADPHKTATVDLPFAPRRQFLLPGSGKLIVADAFGGRLALIDVRTLKVDSVRSLPAHNLRGLTLAADGKHLLMTHQILHHLAQSNEDDIHWGNLLTNNVRSIPLDALLNPQADLLAASDVDYLGEAGRAAGDPDGLAVTADGVTVVALAGVSEVAVKGSGKAGWQRLSVGRRPTGVVTTSDGRRAYVANTSADSVSQVDLKARQVLREIALGKPAALRPADRGEELFHDARLSHDGWFSCHSCHTDGHTSGRLNDNLSDGSLGTPKRILTLRGVQDTGPWAWNSSMRDLETQIRQSVQSTMRGPKPTPDQVRDLVAYLRTLPPPPSLDRLRGKTDREGVRRGGEVFKANGCAGCHAPPTYTSPGTYDVGLQDEAGKRRFNPPSLRGVSQGGPYFHDNRAAALNEVFTKHRHQLKKELSAQRLKDLLAFLGSL
jgi:YVTN family beta-propeller protein